MTSGLEDLYHDQIKDHQRNPRNFGELSDANRHADGFNPLCGDKIALDLRTGADGRIEEIRFKGSGCAISTASASMMTASVKGKAAEEVERMFHSFHDMVTGKEGATGEELGKLKVFAGVKEFPARVKCASLAWHTLEAALRDGKKTVSTDDGLEP